MTGTRAHKSMRDMAQRIVNAEDGFIESVQHIAGCTADDAHQVMAYYLKHKLAKLDIGIGRISVKHGAYLDKPVLQRAISQIHERT